MTFIKSLILAIFATLILTYVFGISLLEMLNISIYMDDHQVEPIKAISISALAVVTLIMVAFAIALSVFGTILFVALLACGGILLVGIGIFWPVLFIAIAIWLCCRDKPGIKT